MKRTTVVVFALLAAALGAGVYYANGLVRVASAYKAKTLCSEIILAGRDPVAVVNGEFAGISPVVDRARADIDNEARVVRASVFGLGAARARFRDGYGCTVETGALAPLPELAPVAKVAWPESLASPDLLRRIDYAQMQDALDRAFADRGAGHRAVVVAVDGRIVAERYADGFSAATPMLSWSMAKSVTAAIVGAAALKGYIDIDDPAPVPEWAADTAKAAITWNDLLRMQSGLAYDEDYGDPASDVSRGLFRSREAGAGAATARLLAAPGEVFSYSSGTTNLLMRTLRAALAERGVDLRAFAREALFAPLGVQFTLEPDSSGTPIGSSYMYATPRDWARLGELHRQGGLWNGERLLPEGWTDYASASGAASNGQYGAQFWLNRDGAGRGRFVPGLPETVYYMAGHEGQYVFVIPDRNAVIVRLGMTRGARRPIDVAGALVTELYGAINDIAPLDDLLE